jgi:twitching motility protein PilT
MQGRIDCRPTAQGTEAISLKGIVLDGPSKEIQKRGTVYGMVEDAFQQGASDIHIQVGEPPRFRIQGKIVIQKSYGRTTPTQFDEFLAEVLSPSQQEQFKVRQELDAAILYEGLVIFLLTQ